MLMNTKRLFLGLDLPSDIKLAITSVIKKLGLAFVGVAWVPENNLHVTLVFLGQVAEKTISLLKTKLATVKPDFPPFMMSTHVIKAFPNWEKCQVIIIELANNPFFNKLVEQYQQTLKQIPEIKMAIRRNITPHITIGRVKKELLVIEKNQPSEMPKLKWEINSVTLYESRLQNNQPPKYLPLENYHISE